MIGASTEYRKFIIEKLGYNITPNGALKINISRRKLTPNTKDRKNYLAFTCLSRYWIQRFLDNLNPKSIPCVKEYDQIIWRGSP